MKTVQLSKGKIALVDDEDFELVSVFKWYATASNLTDYAVRNIEVSPGTRRLLRMHTFLTGWQRVDHINGNGLDNRRSNLRQATETQNKRNRRKPKGSSSIYKGVGWQVYAQKWQAGITVNYKRIHLGLFENEEDAAKAYDQEARIRFGKFATLNFPNDGEQGAIV